MLPVGSVVHPRNSYFSDQGLIMRSKNVLIQLLVLLVTPWLFLSCTVSGHSVNRVVKNPGTYAESRAGHNSSITAVEFKKIKDSGEEFILLDVREKEEYNAAHLPGAINISLGLLEKEAPDKIQNTDTRIYVYCLVGIRSAHAAEKLTEMGYTDVTNISDSFKGWVEAGYPVYNQLGEFVMTPHGFEKKE
jgi:rhodanese-related sulfurtransferase